MADFDRKDVIKMAVAIRELPFGFIDHCNEYECQFCNETSYTPEKIKHSQDCVTLIAQDILT